ncbi:hypothetical protein LINPERPRIM_LOCUS17986 [Linum perenne]
MGPGPGLGPSLLSCCCIVFSVFSIWNSEMPTKKSIKVDPDGATFAVEGCPASGAFLVPNQSSLNTGLAEHVSAQGCSRISHSLTYAYRTPQPLNGLSFIDFLVIVWFNDTTTKSNNATNSGFNRIEDVAWTLRRRRQQVVRVAVAGQP